MTLADGGSKLALDWRSGKPWLAIDTGTWRIEHPATRSFPWVLTAVAIVAAFLVLAAVLVFGRRRVGTTRKEASPQPL